MSLGRVCVIVLKKCLCVLLKLLMRRLINDLLSLKCS